MVNVTQTQKTPYCLTGLTIIVLVFLLFGCNPEAKLPVYTIETEGQGTTLADQTITTAGGTITGADGFEAINSVMIADLEKSTVPRVTSKPLGLATLHQLTPLTWM